MLLVQFPKVLGRKSIPIRPLLFYVQLLQKWYPRRNFNTFSKQRLSHFWQIA